MTAFDDTAVEMLTAAGPAGRPPLLLEWIPTKTCALRCVVLLDAVENASPVEAVEAATRGWEPLSVRSRCRF